MEEYRVCYHCGEKKPLTSEFWTYTDKSHTKFRNKCRKCTNFDSKMSHRMVVEYEYQKSKKNQPEEVKNMKKGLKR